MKLTFESEKAIKLAEELSKEILFNGFNTRAKNDFYDFVLYLLNKYSTEQFLLKNSNYDNAQLLKITPTKLKSSLMNIHLKFADEHAKKDVFESFLLQIAMGKINIIEEENKKGYLSLTIENPAIQFWLEGKLKEKYGLGYDTSFNKEKFIVSKNEFFGILNFIITEDNIYPEFKKGLDEMVKKDKIEAVAGKVIGLLVGTVKIVAGDDFADIAVKDIKTGFSKLYNLAKGMKRGK